MNSGNMGDKQASVIELLNASCLRELCNHKFWTSGKFPNLLSKETMYIQLHVGCRSDISINKTTATGGR